MSYDNVGPKRKAAPATPCQACAACAAPGQAKTWAETWLCYPCLSEWAQVAPTHGALVAAGVPDTAEARTAWHVERLHAWLAARQAPGASSRQDMRGGR